MKKSFILILTVFLWFQCVGGFTQTTKTSNSNPAEQESRLKQATQDRPAIHQAKLGETKNVHRLGNLFFAGQIPKDDLQKLKQQEFKRVITLRTDGEIDWDEKAAVEALGIQFIEIPFRKPETLTDDVFDRVRRVLAKQDEKTLFHCGSANRVGGVWLPYRVLDQGVKLETALAEAKKIGLRTAFIQEKAIDYIQRKQSGSKAGNKKSVNPGINKSYKNPKLNVDDFVRRFEIESREVYLNRKEVVEACEIAAGDVVADVGAGTGLFTRLFSGEVGNDGWVYAVDIVPRFLQHINQEAGKKGLKNITGVLCAENSSNLPPNSVDVVFICDTYHHFEYPTSTMKSIHRALRKDGHLIVIDFERIKGKSRKWIMGHVRAGKEEFRAEIQDAGFTLVDEKKIKGFKENYFLKFRKN